MYVLKPEATWGFPFKDTPNKEYWEARWEIPDPGTKYFSVPMMSLR